MNIVKKLAVALMALALVPAAFAAEGDDSEPSTGSGSGTLAMEEGKSTIDVSTTNCPLLSEGIKVALSKGVAGGYSCDGNTNTIAVSTCNPDGKKVDAKNTVYTLSGSGGKVATSQVACSGSAAESAAKTAAAGSSDPVEN